LTVREARGSEISAPIRYKQEPTDMSTDFTAPTGQYEFDASQNEVIGTLAKRMSLVGIVLMIFGLLQIINGVSAMIISRNPQQMLESAKKAGMTPDQLDLLKQATAGGFWSSPLTVSAIAFVVTGLLLLLIGAWTQMAAGNFGRIVKTKGQDISRLMDGLGSLNLMYGMIYYVVLIAAVISVVSLIISLVQSWAA
jgi:hypothetical protein